MVAIILIGLFFILLSGIVNIIESMKFFKALNVLNKHTKTFKDKMLYPFRLIGLLPLLWRIIPDVLFMGLAGTIGLGGGVMGSVIAMGGTCLLTLLVKWALRATKSKNNMNDYKNELRLAIGGHNE